MKQIISYFTWLFVLSTMVVISPAHADLSITSDEDDTWRTRTAYIVAGLTVIGIAGAIVALSNASGHHKHHTRSYSSDNYHHHGYHYHSNYHHHHQKDHKHHHHHHNSNWNDSSSWESISERDRLWPTDQKIALSKEAEEETQISGVFASQSNGTAEINQGSFTAFVQLPDGTTRTLGRLSLSGTGGTSLHYGPYNQKGSYTFGISLDQAINSPVQLKAGSVEIQVNGSAVQKHDFTLPPHAAANYEPAPCCFDMN